MTRKQFLMLGFGMMTLSFFSQTKDSIELISEVQIDAYQKPTSLLISTKSVSIIPSILLQQNNPQRLLESINLIPGATMEERSPGSYRLALRGSSLRSPFGVRNVKIYFDEFILTDASGNSYLNSVDPKWTQNIELYKGPESGDFGAITGGTVLLKTATKEEQSIGLLAGSYGNFKQDVAFKKQINNHFLQFLQSYQTTDSYRENSAFKRKGFLLKDHWLYQENRQLNAFLLFSDTQYQTPGGLTLSQMEENRKQSRPKTATLPSADEQKIGIYQKYTLAGISHIFPITNSVTHFVVIQGSYMDFKNPFITNYENRYETNWATRTYINYKQENQNFNIETRLGFEGQQGNSIIKNYDNNLGSAGEPQNFDHLKTQNSFLFFNQKITYNNRLNLDATLAYQDIDYRWRNQFPTNENGHINLKKQWLPNFALSYSITKNTIIRAKIGKGSSAPTTEELRSSTQQINTTLRSENGWNKEIGLRKQLGKILYGEISVFDFRLNDAIVRQQNDQGQEYFINSGKTKQQGLEFLLETRPINVSSNFLNSFKIWLSGSFYQFNFEDYRKDGIDYSGNQITGVPKTSIQSLVRFKILKKLNWNLAHYYISKTPLKDDNSVYGKSYWIGNINIHYLFEIGKINWSTTLQIQNIYNTKYVAGFDINAFGNRFYNPAALRNFNIGLQASF